MVGWSGLVLRRAQASRAVVLGRAGSVYAARGGREARSGLSHVHGRHQRPSACLQKRNGHITITIRLHLNIFQRFLVGFEAEHQLF